jgi:predicted AlkP superfamily pyrophosphatase or phosphodiesterase
VLLAGAALAFLHASTVAGAPVPSDRIVLVLSLDGVSSDLLERARTPSLRALAARGARVGRLVPSFPSNTFPVNATIATGCYPDKHGIVNNKFVDHKRGAYDKEGAASWLRAEPLWATAEGQGVRAGVIMWAASEGDWRGRLPSYEMKFDPEVGDEEKVARILEWLSHPKRARPRTILAWFEGVDEVGHLHGARSRQAIERMERTDRAIGLLVEGLKRKRLEKQTVIVVVSDHGLIPLRRVVNLAHLLDTAQIPGRVATAGGVSNVYLDAPWEIDRAEKTLSAESGYRLYRREALPREWHASAEGRIGDLVAVAEPGVWFSEDPDFTAGPTPADRVAGHGYPPGVRGTDGILIAAGPGVRAGARLAEARAVDVYPTVCRLLGIRPAAGIDGRVIGALLGKTAGGSP